MNRVHVGPSGKTAILSGYVTKRPVRVTFALASLGSLFIFEAALRRNAVPMGERLTLAAADEAHQLGTNGRHLKMTTSAVAGEFGRSATC